MESLPSTLLPTAAPQPAAPAVAQSLQNTENFAENSANSTSGLFALLLGQLTIEPPASTPAVAGENGMQLPLQTELPEQSLPLSGNMLPLDLSSEESLQAELLVSEQTTTPVVTSLTPLPVAPQPVARQRPTMISGNGLALNTSSTETPVAAAPVTTTPVLGTVNELSDAPRIVVQPTVAAPDTGDYEFVLPKSTPTVTPNPISSPLNLTAMSNTLSPVATTPLPSYSLNQPVADAQWGTELGQRLIWLNENGIGRAELRMNPPELGPVEVRISVNNDDARVAFQVQHGSTREALESALPRLREMFASQGLNLSDANVSEQSSQGQQQAEQSGDGDQENSAEQSFEQMAMDELAEPETTIEEAGINGVIDAYV